MIWFNFEDYLFFFNFVLLKKKYCVIKTKYLNKAYFIILGQNQRYDLHAWRILRSLWDESIINIAYWNKFFRTLSRNIAARGGCQAEPRAFLIERSMLRWFGHVLGLPQKCLAKWNPESVGERDPLAIRDRGGLRGEEDSLNPAR